MRQPPNKNPMTAVDFWRPSAAGQGSKHKREFVIRERPVKKVEGMGRDAGDAAKSTVEGAKDAAGAVARIPVARAVSGHEKCQLAPNGAPDCVAAASTMCKAKGFTPARAST